MSTSLSVQASDEEIWSENLQESIQAAGQQGKTLFCFVSDDSKRSKEWEALIKTSRFRKDLTASTIRLRLRKDSQEYGFLTGVCPIQHVPALVLIKGGQIEEKLEDVLVSLEELEKKLVERYSSTDHNEAVAKPTSSAKPAANDTTEHCLEFAPSAGLMRLPNNAYDALRERTEKLQEQKISPKNILLLQLRLMDNIPAMKPVVKDIRSRPTGSAPTLSEDVVSRLLNTSATMLQPRQGSSSSTSITADSQAQSTSTPVMPPSSNAATPRSAPSETVSVAPTSPQPTDTLSPPVQSSSQSRDLSSSGPNRSKQQVQRAEYIRQQRDRQAAQLAERERIKAQIKADREERRRLDSIRKQGEIATLREENSTTPNPSSTDIRIQVRTFDGSTLRTTFTKTATITKDVRPWVDETNPDANKIPYNLKIILAPLPNRNIEMEEEEKLLPEIGIVGSATFVMVPVKGYVDSYAASSPGMVGSVIGGVTGAVGSVFSGALGMLGWGSTPASTQQAGSAASSTPATGSGSTADDAATTGSTVKVRTLADQRSEEAKRRGNQLYNGNSLDFQGRKDEDNRKED